ncbi:MAG: DNA repair protein RecO [Rhodospirillaceae bacterium]|jgi:DNA repair protein RecO (recombination protein O)|nr:DNA repair protein RecO [Rhodospirillaceae bacterium]
MNWTDKGILLSLQRYGETGALASVLTREHGRHSGLVKSSNNMRAILQTGNRLHVTWSARLTEHLGRFSFELIDAFGSNWLHDSSCLAGLSAVCAMVEVCLPEREPHVMTFDGLSMIIEALGDKDWINLYVHWEVRLLSELGFSLNLSSCVVSGVTEDLVYVSPKSGCAVSRTAGVAYHDKLLTLPAFLIDTSKSSHGCIASGFALTGYFLKRHVLSPQGKALPSARSRLLNHFLI